MNSHTKQAINEFLDANTDLAELLATSPELVLDAVHSAQNKGQGSGTKQQPREYGLHCTPTWVRERVREAGVVPLAVPYAKALQTHSSSRLEELYGISVVHERLTLGPESTSSLGIDSCLILRGPRQPYMPSAPGEPGVLLSPYPRQDTWPAFENVFSSPYRHPAVRKREDKSYGLCYLGRYELLEAGPINPTHEWPSIPCEVRQGIMRPLSDSASSSTYITRLRARVHLREARGIRNPSPRDVDRLLATSKDAVARSSVKVREIQHSILQGLEKIYVFVLRPVGYDTGICMKLEETNETDPSHGASPARELRVKAPLPSTHVASSSSGAIRGLKRGAGMLHAYTPTITASSASSPAKRARKRFSSSLGPSVIEFSSDLDYDPQLRDHEESDEELY